MKTMNLAEKRREILKGENVCEVGLVTGEVFHILINSYTEEGDPNVIGPGGQVSFMVIGPNCTKRLILTYSHQISYLSYIVPAAYIDKETADDNEYT